MAGRQQNTFLSSSKLADLHSAIVKSDLLISIIEMNCSGQRIEAKDKQHESDERWTSNIVVVQPSYVRHFQLGILFDCHRRRTECEWHDHLELLIALMLVSAAWYTLEMYPIESVWVTSGSISSIFKADDDQMIDDSHKRWVGAWMIDISCLNWPPTWHEPKLWPKNLICCPSPAAQNGRLTDSINVLVYNYSRNKRGHCKTRWCPALVRKKCCSMQSCLMSP